MRLCPSTPGQSAHISVTRRRSALPRWPSFAPIQKHNDHLRERRWSSLTAGHSISSVECLHLAPRPVLDGYGKTARTRTLPCGHVAARDGTRGEELVYLY